MIKYKRVQMGKQPAQISHITHSEQQLTQEEPEKICPVNFSVEHPLMS